SFVEPWLQDAETAIRAKRRKLKSDFFMGKNSRVLCSHSPLMAKVTVSLGMRICVRCKLKNNEWQPGSDNRPVAIHF
ncbi:MAG: hypothetical protein UH625_00955, partial [Muribaculaceae bacterium]|nr:hypothetical protein [Muribaculaceae bacterium]